MITLKAEKRNPNVKAKKLRREGYVTGILSGKEMKEPVALQFDGAEAAKFIKANKEGTQIYLDIEGEKVDALVKNIDYNPIEKQLMALDFQALVAGEKVSHLRMQLLFTSVSMQQLRKRKGFQGIAWWQSPGSRKS